MFKLPKITMIKHSQSTQNNKFLIFDVNYRFLMKLARHVKSTEKGSLLNFSNILRKSIGCKATCFVLYCDAKHSDALLGSSYVCRYVFLSACGQK